MRYRWRENQQLKCVVAHCGWNRYQLSRFCECHRERDRKNGHPEAQLVPYAARSTAVTEAAAFLHQQLTTGHRQAHKAVEWVRRELCRLPRRSDPRDLRYVLLIRQAAEGLDPRDLVARFIAGYLLDDRGEDIRPRFKSERNFRVQAGGLLLLFIAVGSPPWRDRSRSNKRRSTVRAASAAGLKLHAFILFNQALGSFALAASDEIKRRREAALSKERAARAPRPNNS